MMNLLNRKELTTTFNLDVVNEIKSKLKLNEIEFMIKSHSHDRGIPRGLSGSQPPSANNSVLYYIYVNKKDFSIAKSLI